MFVAIFLKPVLHGVLSLLFASFLFFMCGLLGQCWLGQRPILEQSQRWLHHEEMILSQVFGKSRIAPSVETFFTRQSLNAWQSFSPANDLLRRNTLKTSPKTEKFKNLLQKYRQRLQVSQQIFCNLLKVTILRLWVVLLFLPLFGLLGCVGFVDGLTQRHLRKKQGARESGVLYQRAKECVKPSLFAAGVVYIGMPFSLHPQILFLALSVLFGFTLTITARTYKKYL